MIRRLLAAALLGLSVVALGVAPGRVVDGTDGAVCGMSCAGTDACCCAKSPHAALALVASRVEGAAHCPCAATAAASFGLDVPFENGGVGAETGIVVPIAPAPLRPSRCFDATRSPRGPPRPSHV